MLNNSLFLIFTYFFASIPFGLLIGKIFYKKDIRLEGSKNIGATNVFRTCGKIAGILTFLLDGLKGAIPVLIAKSLFQNDLYFIVGIIAILGHIFPIYLNFKGGKGVATTILILFAIDVKFGLIGVSIWASFLLLFGFVSLASIGMSVLLIPFSFCMNDGKLIPLLNFEISILTLFTILFASIIVLTHRQNIERLLQKNEKKMFSKSLF
jgi:glycerol-3-phosphate acyltransferase PlsY